MSERWKIGRAQDASLISVIGSIAFDNKLIICIVHGNFDGFGHFPSDGQHRSNEPRHCVVSLKRRHSVSDDKVSVLDVLAVITHTKCTQWNRM